MLEMSVVWGGECMECEIVWSGEVNGVGECMECGSVN